jgi:Na+-transporting methylmalonyl-CoA/oxaloacetate decarboxylase gamma subunit
MMEASVIIAALGLFLAILVQTIAFVWFLSRLASRVDALEKDQVETNRKAVPDRLIKIETIVEIIQRQQDDQILKLDEVLKNQERRAAQLERTKT